MQKTEQRLKIGVYGRTQAGKTRFLHELLTHWEKNRCISDQSDSCQKFLDMTSEQIKQKKNTLSTTPSSNPEPIDLTVRCKASDEKVNYRFHDLRGETLEDEIDGLDSPKKPNHGGLLNGQVKHCDVFLFFFEPESWEKRQEVDEHHRRELRRARIFVQHVLDSRQNQYLPIIFVISRADCWESDEKVKKLADIWGKGAIKILEEAYKKKLQTHFPDALVTENLVIAITSAKRPDDVKKVLRNAQDLLRECRKFRQKDWGHMLPFVYVASAIIALVVGLAIWIGISDTTPTDGKGPVPPVLEQNDKYILTRVQKLLSTLSELAHVNDPKDSRIKDANTELIWLVTTMNVKTKDIQDATRKEIHRVATELNDLFIKAANGSENGLALLTQYLNGVGDVSVLSEDLTSLQKVKYWKQQRMMITNALAEIMQTMNAIKSDPVTSLTKLAEKLDTSRQAIQQVDVFGPDAKKNLLSEIDVASEFCKKYAKEKKYGTTLTIDSARLELPEKPVSATHAILISPKTAHAFSLTPQVASENVISFAVKAKKFNLDLAVSRSVDCVVSKYVGGEWKEVERFDLALDDSPLSAIGMPLHSINESVIKRRLSNGGYEFVLDFSGLPKIPVLLWTAVGIQHEEVK